jgi:hypothetical protein
MQDERDDLANVRPEEFVAARNAAAKKLQSEGKPDEAAEVKRLRKPTVTRWVADQVLRHNDREVDALRSAVRRIATAQEAAITRGDRDALADATAERRDAMAALGKAVDDVLARDERPRHHHDEVLGTIEADVTGEVASAGTFGLRDDFELPERPAARQPARRDRVAERREAQARAAVEAAEDRVARAREELATAEAALAALRERYGT